MSNIYNQIKACIAFNLKAGNVSTESIFKLMKTFTTPYKLSTIILI